MRIHDYARRGDHDSLRGELQKGVPVDERDDRDYTPLACAARSSQADDAVMKLLIGWGADVNAAVDEAKHTPLSLAACSGDLSKVNCLLEAGATVNRVSPKGYTPLINSICALHTDEYLVAVIDLLAKNGAILDCQTEYGESPLSVALWLDRYDAVRYLLDAGADPSPLHWSVLHKAVAFGTQADVQRLVESKHDLDARDRLDRTPWLVAACIGDLSKARLFHSLGVDLNERDRMGDTALMICAARGNAEMIRWLVDVGADIEAVNGSGNTALIIAAQEGNTECVRFLLDAGAIAHRSNQYSEAAISLAANEPVARLLIDAGAQIEDRRSPV